MAHPSFTNSGGINVPPLPQGIVTTHVRVMPFAELHELRKQENLNWEAAPRWTLDAPSSDACDVRMYDAMFHAIPEPGDYPYGFGISNEPYAFSDFTFCSRRHKVRFIGGAQINYNPTGVGGALVSALPKGLHPFINSSQEQVRYGDEIVWLYPPKVPTNYDVVINGRPEPVRNVAQTVPLRIVKQRFQSRQYQRHLDPDEDDLARWGHARAWSRKSRAEATDVFSYTNLHACLLLENSAHQAPVAENLNNANFDNKFMFEEIQGVLDVKTLLDELHLYLADAAHTPEQKRYRVMRFWDKLEDACNNALNECIAGRIMGVAENNAEPGHQMNLQITSMPAGQVVVHTTLPMDREA